MTTQARTTTVILAIALIAVTQQADAQACLGAASFASGTVRVGAGIDFTDGAKSYGAQVAFGNVGGPFAAVGLSAVDYDDVDETGTVVGIVGGYEIATGASKRGSFCPLVGYEHQSGPNIDTGSGIIDVTGRSFSFGGAFGGIVSSTPTMDFVPFASARYVTSKLTLDDGSSTASATEDFSLITIGAGFVVNRTLTIQPAISFPVGLDGGDPSYGIAFAFSFGSAPKAQMRLR